MANGLWKKCGYCEGLGSDPLDKSENCPDCGGHRHLVFCGACVHYGRFAPGVVHGGMLLCVPCAHDLVHGETIESIRALHVFKGPSIFERLEALR